MVTRLEPHHYTAEELARVLFNKLVKTYPLVTEEWREQRRPLLQALVEYEHDEDIAEEMSKKLKHVLRQERQEAAE